jgi:hypothetical protein
MEQTYSGNGTESEGERVGAERERSWTGAESESESESDDRQELPTTLSSPGVSLPSARRVGDGDDRWRDGVEEVLHRLTAGVLGEDDRHEDPDEHEDAEDVGGGESTGHDAVRL